MNKILYLLIDLFLLEKKNVKINFNKTHNELYNITKFNFVYINILFASFYVNCNK